MIGPRRRRRTWRVEIVDRDGDGRLSHAPDIKRSIIVGGNSEIVFAVLADLIAAGNELRYAYAAEPFRISQPK